MSSYRMTLTCPAGCQYAVSLNDSGYPAEHDEHRSMTAMVEHLAAEHPDYVRAAWAAKAEREYFERVILPDRVRAVEAELSSLLPAMSDLVEFLLARITEDEAAAKDAYYEGQHWYSEEEHVSRWPSDEDVWDADRKRDAAHIVRWQPARVLAECEAKRRIIGLHHSQPNWTERQHNEPGPRAVFDVIFDTLECAECSGSIISDLVDWPCPTLRLLALPYAGHPAYRDEWRP